MMDEDVHAVFSTQYQTREELLDVVRRLYKSKGYAISIRDSRKDCYVTIGCDRGGIYRDWRNKMIDTSQDRETSTRLIDCPFRIRGKKQNDGFWSLQLQNNSHNHEANVDMSGHPSSRRFTNEEILDIDKMCMSGIQPCRYFKEDEDWEDFMFNWNTIIYAKTNESFDNAWASFKELYMDKKDIVDYIGSTWIPYKERFVSAWTEKYGHYGNRVSSRAEGAHAKLKGYLQVSTGDFRQVRDKIILAIDNEFQEIKTLLEIEKIRVPHKYRIPFFKNLVSHVSTFAMNKLYEQYEMAKFGKAKAICTGHFQCTMRLPCAHMMYEWKEKALSLESVHTQWRIDLKSLDAYDTNISDSSNEIEELTDKLRDKYQHMTIFQKEEIRNKISLMLNTVEPTLMEPNTRPHKGRPQKGSIKRKEPLSSTRRDPSQFEIVEASLKRSKSQVPIHEHESYTSYPTHGESALNLIDLNAPVVWLD